YTRRKEDAEHNAAKAAAAGKDREQVKSRSRNASMIVKDALEAQFMISTQVLGPVEVCLQRSLKANFGDKIQELVDSGKLCFEASPQSNSSEILCVPLKPANGKGGIVDAVGPVVESLRLDIQGAFQGLARARADLLWLGTLAVQYHVLQVFVRHSSLSMEHAQLRREEFEPLLHNQSYFAAVVKELYHPTSKNHGNLKGDGLKGTAAARAFTEQFGVHFENAFERVTSCLDGLVPKVFLEAIGKELQDTQRHHWSKFISELKHRVSNLYLCNTVVTLLFTSML
ncbi:hypothetical protein DFQ26_001331, partial [Actinomortierella ambigua]